MTSESPARSTVEEASTPTQSKAPTPKRVFEGHESIIPSIVFLHDNIHVVSGSEDGTMRKWNCDTGLIAGEPWEGEGRGVRALALSPDGNMIACGREDGSVQRWNTDGEMIEGVWMGHGGSVWSLSWCPSGSYLASASDNKILIRKAESGEVDVGPIKTEQDYVLCLAYSPVGDRIASGGQRETIRIWDSKTGELVVGPITGQGLTAMSLAWSLDGTKLYSASGVFARVFDSASGAELHRFGHDNHLCSIALSPKGNVLACVGSDGVAQLWDTETHQQLGQPFKQEATLWDVSFSPNGRYVTYGGSDNKITLWLVNEIAPELAADASTTDEDAAPEDEETRPNSPSSSFLDLEAKIPRGRPGDHEGEGSGNRHKNFFLSSKTSLALPSSDSRPLHHRFWNFVIRSRHRPPKEKSLPPKEKRHKHTLFRRRAREKSPLRMPATHPSEWKEGEHVEEIRNDNCPANSPPDSRKKKLNNGKGKQREDSLTDAQTPAEDREDEHDLQSSAPSGPSRRHAPETESISLRQRPKLGLFARRSEPRPVTIFPGRQKMLCYTSRRVFRATNHSADKKNNAQTKQPSSTTTQTKINAHTEQSSSAAALTFSPAQPQPQLQPQSQSQTTSRSPQRPYTQPVSQHAQDQYDYGCWGNFWHAACCIPHPRLVDSVPPASS